jgi:2-methylcitrate dehydratase
MTAMLDLLNQVGKTTRAQEIARLAVDAKLDEVPPPARERLKLHLLDTLGCAIGAMGNALLRMVREQVEEFGGSGRCTLIGGGTTSPDRAAFCNSALVRYLDYTDAFLLPGETCHPSDNLGSVLAAAEHAGASGADFLTALAVAYEVQYRLSKAAPLVKKGFDHTTQGAFAVAAGVSRALGLDEERATHAMGMCGASLNSLWVTRTEPVSHWKGLAYPHLAFAATHATFLAARGVTGPVEIVEGERGWEETVAGRFEADWTRRELDSVLQGVLKRYNSEVHAQTAIDTVLALRREHAVDARQVRRVEVDIFENAFDPIAGGVAGDKLIARTKEEADHNLRYLMAVALIDGEVTPAQYLQERIERRDVAELMRCVWVRSYDPYTERYPEKMPSRVTLLLRDGRELTREQDDYPGFRDRPMDLRQVRAKFDELVAGHAPASLADEIAEATMRVDRLAVSDLTELLARVQTGRVETSRR